MQSKRELFNNPVIKELIEKEKSYNQDLDLLFNALDREKDDLELVDTQWDLLNDLHHQIKEFKKISDAFIANLNSATRTNESDRVALRKERLTIIKSFFPVYEAYSVCYQNYNKERNEKDNRFNAIEKLLAQDKKRLSDVLSLPFQRGLKYTLLIDAALKNDVHLDKELKKELTLLLETFKTELKKINDDFAEKNRSYQFGDITKSVVGWFSSRAPKDNKVVVSVDEDDFVEVNTL